MASMNTKSSSGILGSSDKTGSSSASAVFEPPLPPLFEDLRPWGVAKFTAGFTDVSMVRGQAWAKGIRGNASGQGVPGQGLWLGFSAGAPALPAAATACGRSWDGWSYVQGLGARTPGARRRRGLQAAADGSAASAPSPLPACLQCVKKPS